MNYAFYDFETTGRSGTWDQIIQVGAVLVNDNFQELDRFEAKCGLKPGLVPEPGALLVNKTTPDMLRKTNLSHYGLVDQMLQVFKNGRQLFLLDTIQLVLMRSFYEKLCSKL